MADARAPSSLESSSANDNNDKPLAGLEPRTLADLSSNCSDSSPAGDDSGSLCVLGRKASSGAGDERACMDRNVEDDSALEKNKVREREACTGETVPG
nr:hypothetical protein CFP56_30933 [Quercus suber]